jgi:hypothetical protein
MPKLSISSKTIEPLVVPKKQDIIKEPPKLKILCPLKQLVMPTKMLIFQDDDDEEEEVDDSSISTPKQQESAIELNNPRRRRFMDKFNVPNP